MKDVQSGLGLKERAAFDFPFTRQLLTKDGKASRSVITTPGL
jgi:hypothetical protein